MRGLYVPLSRDEREALVKLGAHKRRHPRQQAALLIRRALEELNLLKPIVEEVENEYSETHR